MTEITSLEAAKVAAGTKLHNSEALGRVHVLTICSPATAAWAQDDTIASPVSLPAGTRVLGVTVHHEAMGSSVTMDVGLRQTDGTVIDANGIADGIDVASAGVTEAANGELVTVGTNTIYTTAVESVVYATLADANPTDDAQFRIDVQVALPG